MHCFLFFACLSMLLLKIMNLCMWLTLVSVFPFWELLKPQLVGGGLKPDYLVSNLSSNNCVSGKFSSLCLSKVGIIMVPTSQCGASLHPWRWLLLLLLLRWVSVLDHFWGSIRMGLASTAVKEDSKILSSLWVIQSRTAIQTLAAIMVWRPPNVNV